MTHPHVVPQRILSDCEEASLATASGESYEAAKRAIGKTPILPEAVTDPLYGNPINMSAAIERLGYKPIRRTLTDIVNGIGDFRRTVILLRASTTSQHWVCGDRVAGGVVFLHWGDGSIKHYPIEKFKTLFGPTQAHLFSFNAAFEVGPHEGKINRFQQVLNWFKGLFRKR